MRKILAGLLVFAGLLGAPGVGYAQSPIGLYGTWMSGRFPGVGGQVHLDSVVVNAGGVFVGRVSFSGSPCAGWANFSGRTMGDTVFLSMYVGNCGLDEVTLHRQGPGWVGTYRTPQDIGSVTMVP